MLLFIIGLISGIIGGMGIGGGTILIPSLVVLTELNQQQAQGTNLLVFIPTATVALLTHVKNRNINIGVAKPLILTGLIGSYVGSNIAINMSPATLKNAFGIFLFIMGLHHIFSKTKK